MRRAAVLLVAGLAFAGACGPRRAGLPLTSSVTEAERPADSANDFQYKRKAAQRLDANVNSSFFLSGFHLAPE